MSKPVKLAGTKSKHTGAGMPFVVFVGLFGLGLLGYVVGQIFLPVEAHATQWLVAAISATMGGVLGWLWYHWCGDII